MAAEAALEGADVARATAGHAAGGASFPPFDAALFSHQLFWFAIAFGVLLYVMNKIALPGVAQTLDARKAAIEADLAGARAAGESAEAARADHDKLLAGARAKARGAVDEVRAKSAASVAEQTRKSEADLAAKVAAAEAKIRVMRAEALANVRTTAADLAVEIAQKVAGVSVTQAEAGKAVDDVTGRSAA